MFDNLVIAERRVLFYVENMGFVVHYCVLVVSSLFSLLLFSPDRTGSAEKWPLVESAASLF